jgi:hypothetical protein
MITDNDFIYDTYLNFTDKKYTTSFLLNLKPSDFTINPNYIKLNIFKKELHENKVKLTKISDVKEPISTKIKTLFEQDTTYSTDTFDTKGKNIKLYDNLVMRVKENKIFILKNPSGEKTEKKENYTDTNVEPNKKHTLFQWSNNDDDKLIEFEKVEYESKINNKTIYYQRHISKQTDGYIDFGEGIQLIIEQNKNKANIYFEWKINKIDKFSYIAKITQDLTISNVISENITEFQVGLASAIDSETKIINDINNQIKLLENSFNSLQDKDDESIKQIENLQNMVNTIKKENIGTDETQSDNIKKNENIIKSLIENDNKFDNSLNDLSGTVNVIDDKLKTMDNSLNDLSGTVNVIDDKLKTMDNSLNDLSGTVNVINITINKSINSITRLDYSFNDLSGTTDIINDKIKKILILETRQIAINGKIDYNTNNISSINKSLVQNDKTVENIQQQIITNKNITDKNIIQITTNKQHIASLDNSFNDLSKNILDIQKKNKKTDISHNKIDISFVKIYETNRTVSAHFDIIDASFVVMDAKRDAYVKNFDRRLDKEVINFANIKKSVETFEKDQDVNGSNITKLDVSYVDLSKNADIHYAAFLTLKSDYNAKETEVGEKFKSIDNSFNKLDTSFNNISTNINAYYKSFNLLNNNFSIKENNDNKKFKSINNSLNVVDVSFVKIYKRNKKSDISFSSIDISFGKIYKRDKLINNIHDGYNQKLKTIDISFVKNDISFNGLSNNVNNILDDIRLNISPKLKITMNNTQNVKETNIIANSKNWENKSQFNYVEFKHSNTKFQTGFQMDNIISGDTTRDNDILVRNNGIFKSFSMSGDININNIGISKIQNTKIYNNHINNRANIDISKTNLSLSNEFDKLVWREKGQLKFKHTYIKTEYPLLRESGENVNNNQTISNCNIALNAEKNTHFSVFTNDIASASNIFIGTNKFNKFGISSQTKQTGERCLIFDHYMDPTRKNIRKTGTSLVLHSNNNVSIGIKDDKLGPETTDNRLKVNGDIYCDILKTQDISLNNDSGIFFGNYNTTGALLINNGAKFVPRNITGDISIGADGLIKIINGKIKNDMFINKTITFDKLNFTLGPGLVYNEEDKVLNTDTQKLISSIQLKLAVDTTQMILEDSQITIKDRYLIKTLINDTHDEIFENNLILSKNGNNILKIKSNNNEAGIKLDNTWNISKTSGQSKHIGLLKISKNIPLTEGFDTKTIMAFDNEKNVQIGFENFKDIDNFSQYYPEKYKLLINGPSFFNSDIDIADTFGLRIKNNNTKGNILIANGDKFLSKTLSGHATISDQGVFNVSNNIITNRMISDTTKISTNKINLTVDTKAFVYEPKIGKLQINDKNILITNIENNYQIGHKINNLEQHLSIENGLLSFIPFTETLEINGGNQKISLHINQINDGVGKSARFLYLTQLINNIPQINTQFTFDLEKGRMNIPGGLSLNAVETEPNTIINTVFLKNTNDNPTVYFEKGFYIDNDYLDKDNKKTDNKLFLIRNIQNVFRPVSLSGPIDISNNGTTKIKDNTIGNSHLKKGIIKNDTISNMAAISRTKIDLKLGNGLSWGQDNKTIINTLVSDNIVEANRINSKAINTNFFSISEKMLTIKDNIFILSKKNNQYIDGNLYFTPTTFKETGLIFGNSDDYYKISKNDKKGLTVKHKNKEADKNIININNNGKLAIFSETVDDDISLQIGENCKFVKDIYINEIDSGIITNNNTKNSLLMANGTKFISVPLEPSSDISFNTTGLFILKNKQIFNKHINENANIDIAKLNFDFSKSDFEFLGRSVRFKYGTVFRNDQGQRWSIGQGGDSKGSFFLEGTPDYNNTINLFNNQIDKFSSINIGKNNIDNWNLYNKPRNQSFAIKYINNIDDSIVFNQNGNISIGFNSNTNESLYPSDKLTIGANIRIMQNGGLIIDNSGIKMNYKDGNAEGNLLIGQGNNFIPITPSGHLSIDKNGVININSGSDAPIDDTMIKVDAKIKINKTTFNVNDTQLFYEKQKGKLSINNIYLFNTGDGEIIDGGLTLNKNLNTLNLKGTSNNSTKAPGTMIYFQKASNEGTTSKIGYKTNDNYNFEFESLNPTIHNWKFNSNVILSNDIQLTSDNSIIKFNDRTNRKLLISDGNGYKPQWIHDSLRIKSNQFEFLELLNGEKILNLKKNSDTFISSLNGKGEFIEIHPTNDNTDNIAIRIKSSLQGPLNNNLGCMMEFSPLNNDATKRANIGFGLQTNTNRGKFYFTNYHDGIFNFNKDITLDHFFTQEAGPNLIFSPAFDENFNNNGIIFKTNDPTFLENSASIKFIPELTNYTGSLAFFTNDNTKNTVEKERLRIKSNGNIGIHRKNNINSLLHIGSNVSSNPDLLKRLALNCNKLDQQFEFNTRNELSMQFLDIKYSNNDSAFTIASNNSTSKVGINIDNPNETLSISSSRAVSDVSMSIISSGLNTKSILYFGNLQNKNNALKAAIIANGKNDKGKSSLHFCINKNDFENKDGYATINDANMVIQNDKVGINNNNPNSLLTIGNNTNNYSFVDIQSKPGNVSGIKLYRGKGDWSNISNSNYGLVANNQGFEIIKTTDNGNDINGVKSFFTINNNGNVGINILKNKNTLRGQLDVSGTCFSNFYKGDGRYLDLNMHPLLQLDRNYLHNYHNLNTTLIGKFLCYGTFLTTSKNPLYSKKDLYAEETGQVELGTEMWGNTNNTSYYIFRPWVSKKKAFKIYNIIEPSDFPPATTDNYYENWSISIDLSLNKQMIPFEQKDWVALINITNADTAEIYLLNGQMYIKGNGWAGGNLIGNAGLKFNDISTHVIEEHIWTNITLTFRKFRRSSGNYVEVSFYKNSVFIGSFTPTEELTPNFRLKNELMLFNENDNEEGKIGINTGYGWAKNITLYKKTLTPDEISYLYLYPERGLGAMHIEDQSVKIKNLENTVELLTKRLEALETP